jgi:pimeloyl-ACP methyl ester carboxylesterase
VIPSEKPTLLLIPGLLCDEAVWPQAAALRSIANVVIADHGECDSLSAMAAVALAKIPGQGPIAVAGHSMGGRVAYEVYRQAPQRVVKLAVLDTGYEPLEPGEQGEKEKQKRLALLDIARKQGMRAMGIQWAKGMVHPDRLQDAKLMNDIHDMIERKTADQFAAQINALLTRPDGGAVLSKVSCPTLVLCGEQDYWAPVSQHQEIAAMIPNSQLNIVPNCGHMSTMERPDELLGILREWLLAK